MGESEGARSRTPFNHEQFKNIAAGVQSLVIVAGLVAGGIWSAVTLAGPKKAVADAEKAVAEAELARREVAAGPVVDTSITTKQIGSGGERWIVIEVAMRNVGTKEIKLDFADAMKFFIHRVRTVSADGAVEYSGEKEELKHLRFEYPDKPVEWVMLRPKAEYERFQAVQRIAAPGLYLARFAVEVPEDGVGAGREYGAETYFTVQ